MVAVLAADAPHSEDKFLDPESDAPDVENLRGGSHYGDDANGGGSGDDLLVAGTGDDVYEGEGGFDRASYRARSQPVSVGIEAEEGLAGEEVRGSVEGVHGGSGNDILQGNPDPDNLYDGGGADQLFGMTGDDVLDLTSDRASDAAYCGDGSDSVTNGNTLLEPIDVYDGDCEEIPQQ